MELILIAMKKMRLFLAFVALFCCGMPATLGQQTPAGEPAAFRQYQGEVTDADSGDPLVFATIVLENQNISTVTNSEGRFLLKVPEGIREGNLLVSYLGYTLRTVPLEQLRPEGNRIALQVSVTPLPEVDVVVPRDARALVQETLRRKGENYMQEPMEMTAFYRETIKKRRKNASLAEAVVTLYKAPYSGPRKDAAALYKARKSTDYSRLDTVALKLQGGPYNALYVDLMKYPEFIFSPDYMEDYDFFFERNTRIGGRLIFVVGFRQKPEVREPLYTGQLFIDGENKVLTSAIFSLNITDRNLASRMFVRKKPANAEVYPTAVAYRVDYREKDGKWFYSYSNAMLEFKVDWDRRLFNSVYSITSEMAVTDWVPHSGERASKTGDRIRSSIILSDAADGFSDPDFWGAYNIIEPEKSIEAAIRKIQRQLRREDRE